jgi:glucose dehydrogenase
LVYYGTANPGPWNSEGRPGQNYWLRAFSPVDLDTGEAVWFYQTSPHDIYDYDGVNDGWFHAVGNPSRTIRNLVGEKAKQS